MSFISIDFFEHVERDGIIKIERSEIEYILNALFRDILEQKISSFAVLVDKGQSFAVLNILHCHVLKQRRFTHTGFADNVDMLRAVFSFDTKRSFFVS